MQISLQMHNTKVKACGFVPVEAVAVFVVIAGALVVVPFLVQVTNSI